MKLQMQDWIAAQAIQKELLKLIPNDKMIKKFSDYLPDNVEEQKEQQKADENAEYDAEEDYGADYGADYGDYGDEAIKEQEKDEQLKIEADRKSEEDPHAGAISEIGEEVKFMTELPKEEVKDGE